MGNICCNKEKIPVDPNYVPEQQEIFEKGGSFRSMYKLGKCLGRGAFGSVYECYERKDPQAETRAVKIMNKKYRGHINHELLKDIRNEIYILKKINVVGALNWMRYYHAFEDENKIYIVMELYGEDVGDLKQVYCQQKLTEIEIAKIIYGIIKGLKFLHNKRIVHRDIKIGNIMYEPANPAKNKREPLVKIVDFGMATELAPDQSLYETMGTPKYMAPEVFQGRYNEKSDLWSVGIIAYTLLANEPPFGFDRMDVDQIQNILSRAEAKDLVPNFNGEHWRNISQSAKQLVCSLLEFDPRDRISAQLAQKHKWFTYTNVATTAQQLQKLKSDAFTNLQGYRAQNCLKSVVCKWITSQKINKELYNAHQKVFMRLNSKGDGQLTLEELKQGLEEFEKEDIFITPEQLEEIFNQNDENGNKKESLNYLDFFTLVTKQEQIWQKDHLKAAFDLFDVNNDGKISKDELRNGFKNLKKAFTIESGPKKGKKNKSMQQLAQEKWSKVEAEKDLFGNIDAIFEKMNESGDGLINFQQFKKGMVEQFANDDN